MATKCPKCHAENPETKQFCADCGTQLIPSKGPQVSKTLTLETKAEGIARGALLAGRYEILEELGGGGMGEVYRVFDRKLEEEVALKLIRPEIAADRKAIERFKNELKAARKITHKSVCKMYDLGESEGAFYITMEYVAGEDLRSFIHRAKQLTMVASVSIACQVAEGLAEAHKLGIIHRDLKPGNIMIDKEGNAKIMDFGIARSLLGKSLTGEGMVIGTPEYMSPEQIEGKEADARSDIYSLGIILFEMLVGCPPFEGETPFCIANKHKNELPPVPKRLLPQIPDGLNNLILRCLEKDKSRRYQTAEELSANLSTIEKNLPAGDRALTRAKTRARTSREITVKVTPRKLIIPTVTIVALVAIGILGSKFLSRKKVIYPAPVENSFLVVSFDNKTGDRSRDTLRNVFPDIIRTKFEQTGVRYVTTLERMTALLRQAGKPEVEFVDSGLGFELARRDGVRALVTGSYSKSGDTYVTTMRVLDVASQASLATASASGIGMEGILTSQIDDLCRQVFFKLGFGAAQLEKSKIPVSEYSTASLEAYKNFILGKASQFAFNLDEAKTYLEKAVEIDPGFAAAHLMLGEVSRYRGEWNKLIECLEKADALKARASEKERAEIDFLIARFRDYDLERGVAILEELVRRYPKDTTDLMNLATMYRCYLGRYNESTALFERVQELDPSLEYYQQLEIVTNYSLAREYQKERAYGEKAFPANSLNYFNLMADLSFWAGRLDEAIDYFKQVLIRRPPSDSLSYVYANLLHYLYALKEDWGEALNQLDDFASRASTPELKFQSLLLKGMDEVCLGQPNKALQDIHEAQRLIGSARDTPEGRFNRALVDWTRFWMFYERDDLAECRRAVPLWPEKSSQMFFSPEFFKLVSLGTKAALELKEKKLDLVKRALEEMESVLAEKRLFKMPFSSSTDAERGRFLLASLQAERWLAEGSPGRAISLLAGIVPPEPPDFQNTQFLILYLPPFLNDTLARAYAELGQLDKSIFEYEKLMHVDPEIGPRFLPYPKYHLRLAKLFERKGDKAKAKAEYRRFLDLWKDAEPGVPEVEDARKRLAGLS